MIPQRLGAAIPITLRRADGQTRRVGLCLLGGTSFAALLATIALGSVLSPLPRSLPLALLVGTVIAAEHRDRVFGDGTSVSGTIVVVMAAVAYFSGGGWLLGPALCGSAAAIYWPHIRHLSWSRIVVNASSMGLAGAAAALVYRTGGGLPQASGFPVVGGLLAVVAFWIVNTAILSAAVTSIERSRLRTVALTLVRSDIGLVPFALLGIAAGYFAKTDGLGFGWIALAALLALVDLLIARPIAIRAVLRGTMAVALLGAVLATLSAALVWNESARVTLFLPALLAMAVVIAGPIASRPVLLPIVFLSISAAVGLSHWGPIIAAMSVSLIAATSVVARRVPWGARMTSAAVLATCGPIAGIAERSIGGGPFANALLAGLLAAISIFLVAQVSCALQLVEFGSAGRRDLFAQVMLGQLLAFASVGLAAGALGWLVRESDIVGWCFVFIGVSILCARWLRRERSFSSSTAEGLNLNDDEVVDIVRSAILDLPASRMSGALDQ